MKKKRSSIRRQLFVFTPDEKKAAACVLGAILLGLATQRYRSTHPRPSPPLSAREQYQAQRAEKAAKAYVRSASGQRAATVARPAPTSTPPPEIADEED